MKLITAAVIAASLTIGAVGWKYVEPMLVRNGTSVLLTGNGAIKLPKVMTSQQKELLNYAYEIAKADGMKQPQYLQGIIMQESKAGGMAEFRVAGLTNKPGDRYFGIGQIKLSAAKAVMQKHPEMWKHLQTNTEEELQARLILDDKFNIRVASKYLLLMGINKDATFATTAYNRGAGGATQVDPATWHYTVAVKQHIEKLK